LKGIDLLEEAVSRAPTCGLVLVRLANARDLRGDVVGALELHLRAATRHPRYPVPRYRICVGLANVAADVPGRWQPLGSSGQRRLVQAVRRCAHACEISAGEQLNALEASIPLGSGTEVRTRLCEVADLFRIEAQDLFTKKVVAQNSLRRSERRMWAPTLFDATGRDDRKRLSSMIEVSGFVVEVRRTDNASAKADARFAQMLKERSWWQVVYNWACYYAVVAGSRGGPDQRTKAVELLEQLLEYDGSGQLTQAWVDKDPDLDALRQDQRFVEFRSRLPSRSS